MTPTASRPRLLAALACATLAACGSASAAFRPAPAFGPVTTTATASTATAAVAVVATAAPAPAATPGARREPTLARRRAAARQTAEQNASCRAVRPFHWSIGDAAGTEGEGSVGLLAPSGDTPLNIASASKMVYGAYVAQLRRGALTADDVSFLHFTSGYTEFDRCLRGQTVAECQSYRSRRIRNGGYVAADEGRFDYSGGHMEKHATLVGLGPDDDAALAAAVNAQLGTTFTYTQPQLAGGIRASANDYGAFLQRVVDGQLPYFAAVLGTHKVCTNPRTCPTAVSTPVPSDESWHYSIGHWVEDDPVDGDGAYSSAGAFGFYPWISHSKRWWGVLARESFQGLRDPDPHRHPGAMSVYCGREIRAAWRDGQAR